MCSKKIKSKLEEFNLIDCFRQAKLDLKDLNIIDGKVCCPHCNGELFGSYTDRYYGNICVNEELGYLECFAEQPINSPEQYEVSCGECDAEQLLDIGRISWN